MRLLCYQDDDGPRVGVRLADGVAPTRFTRLLDVIEGGAVALDSVRSDAAAATLIEPGTVLAPLRPPKMFSSGINFLSHMDEEPGATVQQEQYFFSKLPSAVVGPGAPIVLPHRDMDVDYEVELAVVIGTPARNVGRADALAHVFGYTVTNDISSRAIQFRDAQVTLGKNADTFAPLGPEIVLADEIPDPAALHIEARVNGELRQSESIANMIWEVTSSIAWLSTIITLEPGDILSLGTPRGCGTFMEPPQWLAPGDVVTVSERTIGELTNPVVAGPAYQTPWPDVRSRFSNRL